ncbi:MAG: hypothetical protein KGI91_12870, partial [Burkholderiales bacterium]|nr:hypothetical protein [Burkholderiales bacterium]
MSTLTSMPRSATVLMYHAVSSSPDFGKSADPHYAVSVAMFVRQLDLMANHQKQGRDIRRLTLDSDESFIG